MNKNSAFVEKLSHDGRGIARLDGKTTFIEGALPGEIVEFEYIRRKKDYDEARALVITQASADRVTPQCPHDAVCGGCSLQHMREEAQILAKQNQLLDLFQRIAHTTVNEVLPPLTASHWHYRHKARLSVRYVEKKQKVLIGFREKKNPRYIAEMQQCLILNQRVSSLLVPMSQLIEEMDAKADIPQVEVAVGDYDVALIFRHMCVLSDADKARLSQWGQTWEVRIFLQPAGVDSVSLFYPAEGTSFLQYALPHHGVSFQFYPTDFTQINPALNQKMVDRALALLDLKPQDRVLDLFCGLGNFSLPIAKKCEYVFGVEGSDAMVQRAQMNAEHNQITNVAFQCANLEEESAIKTLAALSVNKALIDPPRAGAQVFAKQIQQFKLDSLVYISCDPATLARDTEILISQGYELVQAGVMDMFPHTTHVESIALFKNNKK